MCHCSRTRNCRRSRRSTTSPCWRCCRCRSRKPRRSRLSYPNPPSWLAVGEGAAAPWPHRFPRSRHRWKPRSCYQLSWSRRLSQRKNWQAEAVAAWHSQFRPFLPEGTAAPTACHRRAMKSCCWRIPSRTMPCWTLSWNPDLPEAAAAQRRRPTFPCCSTIQEGRQGCYCCWSGPKETTSAASGKASSAALDAALTETRRGNPTKTWLTGQAILVAKQIAKVGAFPCLATASREKRGSWVGCAGFPDKSANTRNHHCTRGRMA